MNYTGAILDSQSTRAFLPQERAIKLYNAIQQFRPHALVTVHHAQRLLGLMASTTSVIQHACLKIWSLQVWYLSLFNPISDSPMKLLRVTPELAAQLEWWNTPHHLFISRPFAPLQFTMQITTDASPTGWGAHCNGLHIHAVWSPSEKHLHINNLELLAIFKVLHAFEPLVMGTAIQITTDNTTALVYINK